jgi:ATP:cob(I)alamin adenosyltransferase
MAGKIYTRSGDNGKTGLYDGTRVDKDDVRIETLGELDEANSTIGLLRSKLTENHPWQPGLFRIQKELMDSMSHIATPSTSERKNQLPIPYESEKWAEDWMDDIENRMESPSEYFLLPGGNEISSLCHVVRTQIRRAERRMITLNRLDPIPPAIMKYVNRLSDLFFKLAREELQTANLTEERWHLFRYKKIKP